MPDPKTTNTVLTRYLTTLVDTMTADYGVPPEVLYAAAGVSPFVSDRVSEVDAEALWVAAEKRSDEELGLKVASRVRYSSYATLGHLLVTSKTVGDALKAACDFTFYVGAAGRLQMEAGAQTCTIFYAPLRMDWRAAFVRSEAVMLPMARFARWASPGVTPLSVALMRPRPDRPKPFEDAFGAPVRFGCARHEITWRRSALDQPMADANPALNEMLRQHVVAEIPKDENVPDRVTRLLVQAMQQGLVHQLTDVARLLGLSDRSLQRALSGAGTNFRILMTDARRRSAQGLLAHGDAPVSEVAARLGYSEPAAFVRAFKRWTGLSPAQWRKREKANHQS